MAAIASWIGLLAGALALGTDSGGNDGAALQVSREGSIPAHVALLLPTELVSSYGLEAETYELDPGLHDGDSWSPQGAGTGERSLPRGEHHGSSPRFFQLSARGPPAC